MQNLDFIDLKIGDKLELKKAHPCGNKIFITTRVGADIKLQCKSCGHVILIEREKLKKIVKAFCD